MDVVSPRCTSDGFSPLAAVFESASSTTGRAEDSARPRGHWRRLTQSLRLQSRVACAQVIRHTDAADGSITREHFTKYHALYWIESARRHRGAHWCDRCRFDFCCSAGCRPLAGHPTLSPPTLM